MKKRWKVSPANEELRGVLAKELNILPITAQLLINRGLVDYDRASSFLSPRLEDLHDPFLMKDMTRAVERIIKAIKGGERIAVWGDYDVDGTTGAALLYLFFKEVGVDIEVYIPDRLAEGYGLNRTGIKTLADSGVGLLITTDCGISNAAEVAYAASLGMGCIVTDHHEVPETMPDADAVLNPRRADCAFPFKGLAGVGVAFNLVVALRSAMREAGLFKGAEPNLKALLDIVCIGTIADMVPLTDENRIFVRYGLKELAGAKRVGLKALMKAASIKAESVDARTVAFQMAPRINAAGRMKSALAAFSLLVCEDGAKAGELAEALNEENRSRREREAEILDEAVAMVEGAASRGGGRDRAIVLATEGWHPGVIGIVASRIVERYGKPTAIIAVGDDGLCKGSLRSVNGINVLDAVVAAKEHLQKFGGHKAAAGLTVTREKLELFRDAFIGFLNERLTDDDLVAEVELDAVVALEDVDVRLASEIERLSPFGVSNREPVLGVREASVVRTEIVGKSHLRLMLKQDGTQRKAIGFGFGALHPIKGGSFDVAFHPCMDEWQGKKRLSLKVKDLRPSA